MRNRYDNFPNRCSVLFCVVLLLMFVCNVTVCACCCCWFFCVLLLFICLCYRSWQCYVHRSIQRNLICSNKASSKWDEKKQQPLVKATWVSLAQQIPVCRSKWQPKIYAQIFVSNNTCGKIKKKKPNLFSTVDRFF